MKKLHALCLFIFLQMNISSVSAGVVGITGGWEFNGYMSMYDPVLGYVGSSSFEGHLDFNGTGSVINSVDPFYQNSWSMHDISITDNGDGTYTSQMLFDWSNHTNMQAEFLWDINYFIDEYEMGQIFVHTLDGNTDGLPGLPITSGFFETVSITLNTSPVPVPAAILLFGSGLIGLIGFTTKKKFA